MKAIIVTIGDEILIGQTVDTNSAYIAQQLLTIGIEVEEIISISDKKETIQAALSEKSKKTNLILMTGGLGPTNDDITKIALAEYFNCGLVFNQSALDQVNEFFVKKGRSITERNKEQAYIPEKCSLIQNTRGTAPGMWFEQDGSHFISMPGVPYEMKNMLDTQVIPKLKQSFTLPAIINRNVLTIGIRESFLADKLIQFEEELPKEVKLAYLPSVGIVKLRLYATGENKAYLEEVVNTQIKKLQHILPKYIFGYDGDTVESSIGNKLTEQGKTLGTAESCTGGYLAHKITSVPGSSIYYKGSIISYDNAIKENNLGVSTEILNNQGAVSEETVRQMITGVIEQLHVDYAIATSGIAGPDGGTKEKPVGTVWIAVGTQDQIYTKLHNIDLGDRILNIKLSTQIALNMLRKLLTGLEIGTD